MNRRSITPHLERWEKENDYVMLSDIFPTGYHATELAGVKLGQTVVIYGAGPCWTDDHYLCIHQRCQPGLHCR